MPAHTRAPDVVYSNILPLNHDIAAHPDVQDAGSSSTAAGNAPSSSPATDAAFSGSGDTRRAASSDKRRKDVADSSTDSSTTATYASSQRQPRAHTRSCASTVAAPRPLHCTAAASTASQHLHAATPLCACYTTPDLHGFLAAPPRIAYAAFMLVARTTPPRTRPGAHTPVLLHLAPRGLTARRLRVRHDSRHAAQLHRPTHGPEHRAAANKRHHRRHASGTANRVQDHQTHDTKCWDKPTGDERRTEVEDDEQNTLPATNALADERPVCWHLFTSTPSNTHTWRYTRTHAAQPQKNSHVDRAHTTVPTETTSSLGPSPTARHIPSPWRGNRPAHLQAVHTGAFIAGCTHMPAATHTPLTHARTHESSGH